jgi:hypothetical protein
VAVGLRAFVLALLAERDVRYEQRYANLDRTLSAALVATQNATDKAERALNERLNVMNEFRASLNDQATRLVTRDELRLITERFEERLAAAQDANRELARRVDARASRGAGAYATWLVLTAAVGVLGTIIGTVLLLIR